MLHWLKEALLPSLSLKLVDVHLSTHTQTHTLICIHIIIFVFYLQAFCKCEELSTRCFLLQAIQMLSVTPTNCNHMLSVGGAEVICDSFTLPDPEQR